MVMTTGIQLIIALADVPYPPEIQPRSFFTNRFIHIFESPPAGSMAFTLHNTNYQRTQERPLSPAESACLAELLARLPAESLTAETASFDGIIYELTFLQAQQSRFFYWQNDDWQRDSHHPQEKWQSVVALADYAIKLAQPKGG